MNTFTTATKNLENDHVYILRLIDVMEKMIQTSGSSLNHLETVVYLIKNFADAFHHAKEENLLFPLMSTKGFSEQQGPVAVMLHDHAEGRSYVKAMSDEIENLKKGNETAIHGVYENFKAYITLLREHIGKENNVLFRMADNVLSAAEQQELLKEFAKLETKGSGGNTVSNFIAQIENLETLYK